MTKLNLLADFQSEMVAGGWGKKPVGKAPTYYDITSVYNKVGVIQGNNATTLGLGIGGLGFATTFQGNNSDVVNFIAA
jgi:hypothetical protein